MFPQLPVVSGALLPSGHCAACLQTSHFCVIRKFDHTWKYSKQTPDKRRDSLTAFISYAATQASTGIHESSGRNTKELCLETDNQNFLRKQDRLLVSAVHWESVNNSLNHLWLLLTDSLGSTVWKHLPRVGPVWAGVSHAWQASCSLQHSAPSQTLMKFFTLTPWSGLKVRTEDEEVTFKRAFFGFLTWDLLWRLTGLYTFMLDYTRKFLISSSRKREKHCLSLTQMVDPYFWRQNNKWPVAFRTRCCCPMLVAVPTWYGNPNGNWRLCLGCYFCLFRP